LLPTVVLGVLYTRILDKTTELMKANAGLAAVVQEQQSQLVTLQQTLQSGAGGRSGLMATTNAGSVPSSSATPADAVPVPYGETPLAGARLEHFRELLSQLRASGFRGKVKVATYVGEFCLIGNGAEGYSMAADDMPVKRCDYVGNPFDDSLPAAQRQSLAFANLVSSLRKETGDALTVEVEHEGRRPSVPYPVGDQLARLTAGEWNRIAAQNNRVEFAAQPGGS
jgi:hypothetical protein